MKKDLNMNCDDESFQAFKLFDLDGDGVVTVAELRFDCRN